MGYTIHFMYWKAQYKCIVYGALIDYINGFWINDRKQITNTSDATIWIPPSQLLCITKVKGETTPTEET